MRFAPYDTTLIAGRIRDFVWRERNFRSPSLTSADVAEAVGIARSTLIKVMREGMGVTFLEYLDTCRVRYARRMLMRADNRLDAEQVALLAGFGSRVTFYRKYKAVYGELPTDTIRHKKNTVKPIKP